MLTHTFHSIQSANEKSQVAAQENIQTLQTIVQTTHEQSRDTQQNVASLGASMATITTWIQAQPIQEKQAPTAPQTRSDNGLRTNIKWYKIPRILASPKRNPEVASPRRQTDHENNLPDTHTTHATKKLCMQTTPQQPTLQEEEEK